MKNLDRSICSTCKYVSDCVLTTDKSNISSCSEYIHQFEKDDEPSPFVTFEMFEVSSHQHGQEKPVLSHYLW